MGSKRQVKGRDGRSIRDKWELFIDLPRRESDLRKRPRLTRTFYGTAKEAERELRRLEREAAAGALSGSHLTVRALFERYLNEYVAHHRAPARLRWCTWALLHYASPLHDLKLVKVERHHLSLLESHLRKAGTTRMGKEARPLADVTVTGIMSIVRQAFQWAEDVDLLMRSPARRLPTEMPEIAEQPSFSVEEARRFLDAIAGSPWELHLSLLLLTNLRLSELRGLRWRDLNLNTCTYRVQQQWQRFDGAEHLRPVPKSKTSRRSGALPALLVDQLRAHQEEQRFLQRAAGKAWQDNDLVLTNESGAPFNADTMRRAHYKLLSDQHLPRIRLHGLRHSWLNLQLAAGTPMHEASKLMGHSSEKITREVYQHLDEQAIRGAADRLWELLHPPQPTGEDASGHRP